MIILELFNNCFVIVMINMSNYIKLEDLQAYILSRKLSTMSWSLYNQLSYSIRITMGDQFIRSTDSVGANIAEGYGRWHYLDKAKFYYHSRGSLYETRHWAELFHERKILTDQQFQEFFVLIIDIGKKLNNLISQTKKNCSN